MCLKIIRVNDWYRDFETMAHTEEFEKPKLSVWTVGDKKKLWTRWCGVHVCRKMNKKNKIKNGAFM